MRIISKERDYYDSVQMYGQDQGVVYIRNKDFVEEDLANDTINKFYKIKSKNTSYYHHPLGDGSTYRKVRIAESGSIFFCGDRHNFIITERTIGCGMMSRTEKRFHYSMESLDSYIDELNLKDEKEPYYRKISKNLIVDFFNNLKTEPNLHFEINAPIFIISAFRDDEVRYMSWKTRVQKNPILSDYNFAAVKDPYSAYQELDMFISGVMGGKSPVVVNISDDDMKQQKGFGHKYAFKTEPTKRR